MNPIDLIRGKDGRMVLTKLAAATFHLFLAMTVASITAVRIRRYIETGDESIVLFDVAMWTLYSSAALVHAIADKTGAQYTAFKNRKLEVESEPAPSVTSTTTTTEIRP